MKPNPIKAILPNSMLVLAFIFPALPAFAILTPTVKFNPEIICRTKHGTNAESRITTRFQNLSSEQPTVQFTLPTKENGTETFLGTCGEKYQSYENTPKVVCRVEGYIVGLYYDKNEKLISSVVEGDDTLLVGDLECSSVNAQ